MSELKWIRTAEQPPDSCEEWERVFTLPVTLSGKADITWTYCVQDEPERYPYWISIDAVLEWLQELIPKPEVDA